MCSLRSFFRILTLPIIVLRLTASTVAIAFLLLPAAGETIRSAKSGEWSSAETWEGKAQPKAGDVVLIRAKHRVTYDVANDVIIRAVHVAGTLAFAPDRNTKLCTGLIRIASGEDCTEEGFDCHARPVAADRGTERPALEVGTPQSPIEAGFTALLRLTYIEGMDRNSFPALVCCGGRMDLHGARLNRSWVKLQAPAYPGSTELELAEPVEGWRAGDRVLVPTTEGSEFYQQDAKGRRVIRSLLDDTQTEEAEIAAVAGRTVILKRPFKFKHQAEGRFRGEVANLSRNVVVESADPAGPRGHTMYHRNSAGSISYAEFRHLGKEDVLGRYPIHFHQCGDTMRGSSVVGASIWDSHNRWLTIHGTDYLVVRDCVGYRSVGHGYFFEDGTEVYNLFDRNLGVQALMGKPLPDQVLNFDTNDAAGFWWANCLNSFTRNVAVECEKHGFRFQMAKTPTFDPRLLIRQADGTTKKVDARTVPFVRFEANEARSQRRFALNLGGFHGQSTTEDLDRDGNVIDRIAYLGGDVQGVGPDEKHPFRIKDFLVWRTHWGFHTTAPNVVIDGFVGNDINYAVWRSNTAGHDYNRLDLQNIHVSTFFNNWGVGSSRADLLRYALAEDDAPPISVVTRVDWLSADRVRVFGVSADDTDVREIRVNGQPAEMQDGMLAEWSVILPVSGDRLEIEAAAVDSTGNQETAAHRLMVTRKEAATLRVREPLSAAPAMRDEAQAAAPKETIRETPIDSAQLKWPLWNGRETVEEYAKRAKLAPERILSLQGEKLELRLVPAGSFLMGSPGSEASRAVDEGPRHRVVVCQPYYMGKFEVTQAQYEQVMGANPSFFKGSDRPVEQVTWSDAQTFLRKAGQGLCLPTEAQWEFACRAGTTDAYFTGNSEEDAHRAGWYGYSEESERAHANGETHPVGGKAANGFGLHDLHGNVYEWCADWYAPNYYQQSPSMNPTGASEGDERVLRGGSWEAPAASARSANRNGFSPNSRGYVVGFRVALPVSSNDSPSH
jgi:formylglycine-generating enzyme required for sulfatase activity